LLSKYSNDEKHIRDTGSWFLTAVTDEYSLGVYYGMFFGENTVFQRNISAPPKGMK
jgi:hypothetical protein